MVSLFAQLFLAIQDKIVADVPEIVWIDQDLGQLESYSVRPNVQFPCVLIDFPNTVYSNNGQQVQWADIGSISIRLGFAPYTSANSEAPDISKEDALNYYELEHKLYMALEGFDADGAVQPLNRISAQTENRDDTFRVRQLVFTTATEDDSAKITERIQVAGLQVLPDVQ